MTATCSNTDEFSVSDKEDDNDIDDVEKEVALVRHCLSEQLSELELLQSMYPEEGALVVEDATWSLAELECFCEAGRSSADDEDVSLPESRLGYCLRLCCGGHAVDLTVHLPLLYPAQRRPELFLRCTSLGSESRAAQRQLNDALNDEASRLALHQIMLCHLIFWLQEHTEPLLKRCLSGTTTPALLSTPAVLRVQPCRFVRLWIYSHHIYSKLKRRDILDWSADLGLTGFSMPGKPGIVCVEGDVTGVDAFWMRLRKLTWKKLSITERSEVDVSSDAELQRHRRFTNFEEKQFGTRAGKACEYHMDMGQFFSFLQCNGFQDVFQLYFGVPGQAPASV